MINIESVKIEDLIPYAANSRTHSEDQVSQIAASIKEFGFSNPVLIDAGNGIIAGHGRVMAAKKLKMEEVPCLRLSHLTDAQRRAYVIADNKIALNSGWDLEALVAEINRLTEDDFDIGVLGFSDEELNDLLKGDEIVGLDDDDAVPELSDAAPVSKEGDIWLLGGHRVMCGDSTDAGTVALLMNGEKADMVFTDPPYGMKKEKDGVKNDNLNYSDLLDFNKKWIPLTFSALKENGSWYCWGIDEPLMDIYSEIIKPYIAKQQATFRNLITWDKGCGQGQNSDNTRSYAMADEKCLFVMMGVQECNNNADNYFEGWEVIRGYLLQSRLAMGWDVPTMKKIVGHSDLQRDHWTSKSQFSMPTREVYEKMKAEADRQRSKTGNDAFKKEYDEIKKEYYSTRAYFNNTHDNFNNVWSFARHKKDGSEGGHATPKPIDLCERAIKSSSREGELVLDLFGGSGSTLIACEKTKRKCYMMELAPNYCDVIIKRWQNFTGKEATLEGENKTFKEISDGRA